MVKLGKLHDVIIHKVKTEFKNDPKYLYYETRKLIILNIESLHNLTLKAIKREITSRSAKGWGELRVLVSKELNRRYGNE